ncbi:MAG: thioredoxin domain-containing protein [Verrucomicrobiota bacterium]
MRKNSSPLTTGLLLLAMPAFVGCDRLKSVAGNLGKLRKPAAEEPVGKGTYSSDQVSNVTKSGFATAIARKNALVVIDFHAEWCGPCKVLGPVLLKATEAHPGVVYLGKVDVDQSPELAAEHKVSGIPDVRIYKDGKEVDRFVGFPGEQKVLSKIAELSKGIQPPPPSAVPVKNPAEPAVKPFEKGWLPPGVTRQKAVVPPTDSDKAERTKAAH